MLEIRFFLNFFLFVISVLVWYLLLEARGGNTRPVAEIIGGGKLSVVGAGKLNSGALEGQQAFFIADHRSSSHIRIF